MMKGLFGFLLVLLLLLISPLICISSIRSIASFQKNIISTAVFSIPLLIIPAAQAQQATNDEAIAPSSILKIIPEIRPLMSDEFEINISTENIGLKLQQEMYKGFPVVTVSGILDEKLKLDHPELRIGAIVTKVGDVATNGITLNEISKTFKLKSRPFILQFRDPSRFFESLDSASNNSPPLRVITTSYLPANTRDEGAPEQIIRVERVQMPPVEQRTRSAQYLDVLEMQYIAQIDGTDAIVDSSAAWAPPGYSSKTIYFVLGQKSGPLGLKIPPGWDLSLRGMVVGETRKIFLPYTLCYDRKGNGKNIPPFANLVYTVRLVSLS